MVELSGGLDRGGEGVLGGHGVRERRVDVVEVGGEIRSDPLDGLFGTDTLEVVGAHADKTFPGTGVAQHGRVGYGGEIGSKAGAGRRGRRCQGVVYLSLGGDRGGLAG